MLIRLYALLFTCCLGGLYLPDLAAQCAISVTPTPASCGIGSLTVQVTGGTSPYNYSVNGGSAGNSLDDLFLIPDLSAGSYAIVVTDATGCTATASTTITEAPALNLATTQINLLCNSDTTGSIDLHVSGGAFVYTFNWSNGATSSDLSNLAAGPYTVTVTDANGCTKTTAATITEPPALELVLNVNNLTCFDGNDGAINLVVAGGTPPYTYHWTNGLTVEDLSEVSAGTYCVTVTDANACTATACATIVQPVPITLAFSVLNLSCSGQNDGSIDVFPQGGVPPYTYLWSIGSTTQDIAGLPGGDYSITITDANGCTKSATIIVTELPPIIITPTITYTNCSSAKVEIQVDAGQGPYAYVWTNGNTSQTSIFLTSGTYYVTVTNSVGCIAVASFTIDLNASGLCGTIQGQVLRDTIENCQDDGEPGLANWIVQAVGTNTYYAITDSAGQYSMGVASGDTYTLSVVAPNALWEPCPVLPTVTVSQPTDTVPAGDLLVKKVVDCPALTVSIATGQLRRCFSGFYTVNYCNDGTTPAENAYVIVTLDEYLSLQNTSIPYTNLGNGQLRFDLDFVDIGECGSFKIYVNVSCDATLGQTHCTEAHIYPDSPCLTPNPLWSGASLEVNSICDGDSLHFVIKNVGTGNLEESINYIVIEDQVMLMQAPMPLLAVGESVEIAFPANGSTWRLEVQQAAFHPGASQSALSVEGCTTTGTFSTGFVSQFPVNDEDPWLDIDCTENVGSYDPNDKQGFPTGYGAAHYIRPGTDIEYKIRFQNTGTDTAFNIVVIDTLSEWLDPASVRFGASSHPYRAELYGSNILKFHFENILLADSNINEVASHGFLQFRISPRANAPLETLVENQAAIYFDFNEPVLTNTTFHRLGEQFVTSGLWQPQVAGATISVSPNPFDQQARLEIKGMTTNTPLELQVFDLQGNKVREMTSSDSFFLLKKGDWPTGVYLFRISQKGKLIGSGKLMVQ